MQCVDFGWVAASGLVQVHTSAEGFTLAIKQDCADGGVGLGLFQRLDQSAAKFAIKRVALVRAVEREMQQPAILNRLQNGVRAIAHVFSLQRQGYGFGRRAEHTPIELIIGPGRADCQAGIQPARRAVPFPAAP